MHMLPGFEVSTNFIALHVATTDLETSGDKLRSQKFMSSVTLVF